MSAFTNFIIIGNLISTPEQTTFGSGGTKTKFRLRCDQGDKINFYDITTFGEFNAKVIRSLRLEDEISVNGRIDSKVSDKGFLFLDLVAKDIMPTKGREKSFSHVSDRPRQVPPKELDQTVMFTSEDIPF